MTNEAMEGTLNNYLEAAASGSPTPGGGSIAALAGALGSSMAAMVGAFTLSSKKYAKVHERIENIRNQILEIQTQLGEMVQADMAGYAQVSQAYSMNKTTNEEKSARSSAIKEACNTALQPPIKTIRALRKLAAFLPEIAEIGNKNLITDTGVSALLSQAAFESAVLNVRINLGSLGKDELVAQYNAEISESRKEITYNCQKAIACVEVAL